MDDLDVDFDVFSQPARSTRTPQTAKRERNEATASPAKRAKASQDGKAGGEDGGNKEGKKQSKKRSSKKSSKKMSKKMSKKPTQNTQTKLKQGTEGKTEEKTERAGEGEGGNPNVTHTDETDGTGGGVEAGEDEEMDRTEAEETATPDYEGLFGKYTEQRVVQTFLDRETSKGCTAESCFPPYFDFAAYTEKRRLQDLAPPAKPAKEYQFVLDPFQEQSVACIERDESVMVSAHTSAGKTVVAEYAIASSLRDGQRVIYTSPIKALSNQKYRELHEEFNDVGLMTGDITINPSASCLVMTTEILRNMLYRGSEVMREVKWVVFDEVHYMNNPERGVVWEETIIMLPDSVRYVFLSATVPNATEFCLWIAKLHRQPCSVVYTEFRPTPLQHYVFPSGGDGVHLVVDDKGNFKEQNFQKALAALGNTGVGGDGDDQKGKKKRRKKNDGPSDIFKILRMIMDRNLQPCIVFSFSKRECEANALALAQLDFCSVDEKKLIGEIFSNAMDSLSTDDRGLPQVQNILPLLKRGLGIHHGGLLPILKEVVEILFGEGLLKVLFATETFAMGLNMPAKTVVFTSVRKFDGKDFRVVSSGEYIQMSGRAGRRGLDARGIVMLMLDEKVEPPVAKDMIKGEADRLQSSFHLGYNMLLNLLRVEHATPEYMMARSLFQFQQNRAAPDLMIKLEEAKAKRDRIHIDDRTSVSSYHHLQNSLARSKKDMQRITTLPLHALPFLNPGRLAHVVDGDVDWGWGVVVNFQKKQLKAIEDLGGKETVFVVDMLLHCQRSANGRSKFEAPKPCVPGDSGEMKIVPVLLSLVTRLSSVRLIMAKDLKSAQNRRSVGRSLKEAQKRLKGGIPLLHPIEDMKIKDSAFETLCRRVEALEDEIIQHPLHKHPDKQAQLDQIDQQNEYDSEIASLKEDLKNATQDTAMRQELKGMKRVLRRLGHCDADNVIALKGRVACEISTGDELLGAELLFSGFFTDLSPEHMVALCSCLVFSEKSETAPKLKEELGAPLRELQAAAKRIGEVIQDSKLPIDVEEYVAKFQPNMMDVVFAWVKGAKFSDVCKLTDIFEGSIIRVMRRLEELLRQMAQAAQAIGNEALHDKFQIGIEKLKRDIVFAASLYL